jgi:hypothetical protein
MLDLSAFWNSVCEDDLKPRRIPFSRSATLRSLFERVHVPSLGVFKSSKTDLKGIALSLIKNKYPNVLFFLPQETFAHNGIDISRPLIDPESVYNAFYPFFYNKKIEYHLDVFTNLNGLVEFGFITSSNNRNTVSFDIPTELLLREINKSNPDIFRLSFEGTRWIAIHNHYSSGDINSFFWEGEYNPDDIVHERLNAFFTGKVKLHNISSFPSSSDFKSFEKLSTVSVLKIVTGRWAFVMTRFGCTQYGGGIYRVFAPHIKKYSKETINILARNFLKWLDPYLVDISTKKPSSEIPGDSPLPDPNEKKSEEKFIFAVERVEGGYLFGPTNNFVIEEKF